jgi:hypothetical protein
MRVLLLALFAAVATPAFGAAGQRDPAVCLQLFEDYDNAAWLYPQPRFNRFSGGFQMAPAYGRPTRLLRANGCLTLSRDLDGIPALAARLQEFERIEGGPTIRPTALHLGVVLSIGDEARVTQFFRGLGYRSRGVGADGLGRRLYIGPFTSQGALDQAAEIAREAGFISPYPPRHTRF